MGVMKPMEGRKIDGCCCDDGMDRIDAVGVTRHRNLFWGRIGKKNRDHVKEEATNAASAAAAAAAAAAATLHEIACMAIGSH
eukprot:865723-Pelagomonas_calceolata.AAC.4